MDETDLENEMQVECSECGEPFVVFPDLYNRPKDEIREVATCTPCSNKQAAKAVYEQEFAVKPMGQQALKEQERQ